METNRFERHLHDKLIRALQHADQGRITLQQLETCLKSEVELVLHHFEAAPERDCWTPYLQALKYYNAALCRLLQELAEGGALSAEGIQESLELAYQADGLLYEQQQNVQLEIVLD